jgi:arylsulfatase A-like enzyme
VACAIASLILMPVAAIGAQPNILFIAVDDQTYKFTSTFGKVSAQTTPNLDALARRGVRFTDGIVQGTECAPSRNSTITGRYPHQLGFYLNDDLEELPGAAEGFPAALQRAGYHTAWIGKSHLLPNEAGLRGHANLRRTEGMRRQFGLDEVFQHPGRWVSLKQARKLHAKLAKGWEWRYGQNDYLDFLYDNGYLATFVEDDINPTRLPPDYYMDGYISRSAEDWLAAYEDERPFLLYLNYSAPHDPFDQPREYQNLYSSDQMPPIIKDKHKKDIPDNLKPRRDRFQKARRNAYRTDQASMITYQDAQLRRILTALERSGQRENTLIVYYSDHGIMTGDHGLRRKATLYKEVLHAHLVIDLPDDLYPESTDAVSRPVELLDAVQSALHVAGVPPIERARYEGQSLLPLITEAVAGRYQRQYAFAQVNGSTSVQGSRWKYIDHKKMPVLFDRTRDPDELVNVYDRPEFIDVVRRLQNALADFYDRTGRPRQAGGRRAQPRDLVIGGLTFLTPPRYEEMAAQFENVASHTDADGIRWARVSVGEDGAAACELQGARLADQFETDRFVEYLNGNGARLALVRLGWPDDGSRHYVSDGDVAEDRIVAFNGTRFVRKTREAYLGFPLCVTATAAPPPPESGPPDCEPDRLLDFGACP